jgi:aquaporin Z
MLLAAQLYLWLHGKQAVLCAKLQHDNHRRCIFRCNYKALTTPTNLQKTVK